jgi:alkaline phosphatase D
VPVTWFVSQSNNLSDPTGRLSGTVPANGSTDFTVKVDITGLQPDTRYFYAFQSGNYSSQLGTTKTLPNVGGTRRSIRLAQQSCVNWRFGYWHVHNITAQIRDIDALIFLGDWIYEYGDDYYPTTDKPPFDDQARDGLVPPNEVYTVADYRLRHQNAKSDRALQEMQRRVPLIAIWDDHDVADNAWKGGSLNTKEPEWRSRVANGTQAWHEYVPIRTQGQTTAERLNIYRSFTFGSIATVAVVEGRFLYRTEQYDYNQHPYIQALSNNPPSSWDTLPNLAQLRASYYQTLANPNMTIIGPQMQQLRRDFAASKAAKVTWQLFGNGVIVGPRRTPDVETAINELYSRTGEVLLGGLLRVSSSAFANVVKGVASNARVLVGTGRYRDTVITDGWDGYVYDRNELFDIFIKDSSNPVVLAGDSHNAWAYNLINPNTSAPIGVEFDDASVTPPGLDELDQIIPGNATRILERAMFLSNNDTLKYAEIGHRGTIVHTITQDNYHADFYFVDTVLKPETGRYCGVAYDVKPGAHVLQDSPCTPDNQLFFQLGSNDDPLTGFGLDQAAILNTALFDCLNPQMNPPEQKGFFRRIFG